MSSWWRIYFADMVIRFQLFLLSGYASAMLCPADSLIRFQLFYCLDMLIRFQLFLLSGYAQLS